MILENILNDVHITTTLTDTQKKLLAEEYFKKYSLVDEMNLPKKDLKERKAFLKKSRRQTKRNTNDFKNK